MVISDAAGNRVACMMGKDSFEINYWVYGYQPYFKGQNPTGKTDENGSPLYAWFKIWSPPHYPYVHIFKRYVFRILRSPREIELRRIE